MAIVVAYHSTTRVLLGAALTEAALLAQLGSLPEQSVVATLSEWAAVPTAPYAWNPARANFAVPAREELLTQQEFMDRWELSGAQACMDLLFALEPKDSTEGTFARKTLTRFRTARGIDPADPRTVLLTDTLLGLGVTRGLITSEVAATARPVVLAPL
jgi:hypothetical protein